MSNAWSHLPNAHHIDWVLASLKENPELWAAARDAAWDTAVDAAGYAAWDAAWDTAVDAAGYAARSEARDAAWAEMLGDAVRDAARNAAWFAAWDAIAALVAYDDCDYFLNMSYEKLKIWAAISEDPRAILLLPMVCVTNQFPKS